MMKAYRIHILAWWWWLIALTSVGNSCDVGSGFTSPSEVFAAFRDARAKRDWKSVFLTMTQEMQNTELLNQHFNSLYQEDDSVQQLLERNGVAESQINAKYTERYLKMHGIDLNARVPELRPSAQTSEELILQQVEPRQISAPPIDWPLMHSCVLDAIADKQAFYVDLMNATVTKEVPTSNIDDVRNWNVHDGHASGNVAVLRKFRRYDPDTKSFVVDERKDHVRMKFRRVNGRWYVDGVEATNEAVDP